MSRDSPDRLLPTTARRSRWSPRSRGRADGIACLPPVQRPDRERVRRGGRLPRGRAMRPGRHPALVAAGAGSVGLHPLPRPTPRYAGRHGASVVSAEQRGHRWSVRSRQRNASHTQSDVGAGQGHGDFDHALRTGCSRFLKKKMLDPQRPTN